MIPDIDCRDNRISRRSSNPKRTAAHPPPAQLAQLALNRVNSQQEWNTFLVVFLCGGYDFTRAEIGN